MRKHDAIAFFGTQTKLAATMTELGFSISQATISEWGEYPPLERQFQIELATKGALKADIPEIMREALSKRMAA